MHPSFTTRQRRPALLIAAAAAALALTGCGSGSIGDANGADTSPSAAENDADLTAVTLGAMPIAATAAIEYGIAEGIFEEHGFDVDLSTGASGAAMLPAVFNQQVQFGVGNPLSVSTAIDQGMDMRIIAGYSSSYADGDDIAGVVVREDSDITSYADLSDASVAVVSLRTHADLTILDAVESDGGDASSVQFNEMQFGDMAPQLEQDSIDAAFLPEPFLGQALQVDGLSLLGYSMQDTIPGLPTLVTFTSGDFAESNPEVVESFRNAITEVLDAASQNEDGVKEMLPDLLSIPSEAAQHITLEDFDGEIRRDQIEQLNDLGVMHGYLGDEISPDALFFD
ncbi:MAG: ABC transporter substrate-binding protein [Micrococcaceae bacterium]